MPPLMPEYTGHHQPPLSPRLEGQEINQSTQPSFNHIQPARIICNSIFLKLDRPYSTQSPPLNICYFGEASHFSLIILHLSPPILSCAPRQRTTRFNEQVRRWRQIASPRSGLLKYPRFPQSLSLYTFIANVSSRICRPTRAISSKLGNRLRRITVMTSPCRPTRAPASHRQRGLLVRQSLPSWPDISPSSMHLWGSPHSHQLHGKTPTLNSATDIVRIQNAGGRRMSRLWRIFNAYVIPKCGSFSIVLTLHRSSRPYLKLTSKAYLMSGRSSLLPLQSTAI
jgi:hypothetical protein